MDIVEFLLDRKNLEKIVKGTPTLSKKYVNVKQSEIQKLFVLEAYLKTKPTDDEFEKTKVVLSELPTYKDLNQTLLEIDNNYLDEIKKGGVLNVIEKLWLSRPQTFAEWLKAQIISQNNAPMQIVLRADGKTGDMNISRSENQKCQLMAQYLKAYPDVTQEEFANMLCTKGLADYRKLVKDYRENDYVQELRDHGGNYLALRVHTNREFDKKFKKLEKDTEKLDRKFK